MIKRLQTGQSQRPPAPAKAAPRPQAQAKQSPGVTLDVLTLNTWGKPGLLGTEEKERMELIGPRLRPYSIASLQETFTRHAKKLPELSGMAGNLERNGSLFHLNSGLTTLSKFPVKETAFFRFEEAADADAYANKGVSFTRLEVPGIGEVDIYNTHYQSKAKNGAIRLHDNDVLVEAVRKMDKGNPTFIMGDFNMVPGSPEYTDLVRRLNLVDTYAAEHPGTEGYTAEPANTRRPDDGPSKRIDYLFLRPNPDWDIAVESVDVAMTDKVNGHHLSDHYGVAARFHIRRKPGLTSE